MPSSASSAAAPFFSPPDASLESLIALAIATPGLSRPLGSSSLLGSLLLESRGHGFHRVGHRRGNSEHFFVITQMLISRKEFKEVTSVPVIFGLRNSLFIKQPSALQCEYVKSSEEKRLYVSESEYRRLFKSELKNELANNSRGNVLEEALSKIMPGVAEKS